MLPILFAARILVTVFAADWLLGKAAGFPYRRLISFIVFLFPRFFGGLFGRLGGWGGDIWGALYVMNALAVLHDIASDPSPNVIDKITGYFRSLIGQ